MTEEEYSSLPGLRSSEIHDFLEDPGMWWDVWVAKTRKKPSSDSMQLGSAIHAMIERGGPSTMCKTIPLSVLNDDGHRKGKKYTDWLKDNPADHYVKEGEPNELELIWNNLHANDFTRGVIESAELEVACHWADPVLGWCKVRFDAVNLNCDKPYLLDWKSCDARSCGGFAYTIANMHYDVRLALYQRAFRHRYGVDPEVYIVAIKTSGSYTVKPWKMPKAWMDDAGAELVYTVCKMQEFDIAAWRNAKPEDLEQPRRSRVKSEAEFEEAC